MKRFTVHRGIAAPLRSSNVDTDQILPAEYLKRITRTGFEDGLFAAWRKDPEFILNDVKYASATVLVTGPDFGTGSSREHAVWALQDYGFRVVVAPRFGDIFRSNAGKSGMLAAVIDEKDLNRIWAFIDSSAIPELTINLEQRLITDLTATKIHVSFEIDEYTRWRLLNGLDDIAVTLQSEEAIVEFESGRSAIKPALEQGTKRSKPLTLPH